MSSGYVRIFLRLVKTPILSDSPTTKLPKNYYDIISTFPKHRYITSNLRQSLEIVVFGTEDYRTRAMIEIHALVLLI